MPNTLMNLYLPCTGDIWAYWAKRDPKIILQYFPQYLSADTEGNDPISSPSLRKNFEFLAQSNPEKIKKQVFLQLHHQSNLKKNRSLFS